MRNALLLVALSCLVACGAETPPEDNTAIIEFVTEQGNIKVELYIDQAPVSAQNFFSLAAHDALDEATFYRVVSPDNDRGDPVISVIQGGLGDAADKYPPIAHETTAATGLKHVDGALSMARAAVGTASTEFFICVGDQPSLDFGGARNADGQGFAVFGQVIGGMEVVRRIHGLPADAPTDTEYFKGQLLTEPVRIRNVVVVQFPPSADS